MQYAYTYLGNFGRFQGVLYAIASIGAIVFGADILSFTWTGYMPDARLDTKIDT